jgi:hypothetical protein
MCPENFAKDLFKIGEPLSSKRLAWIVWFRKTAVDASRSL